MIFSHTYPAIELARTPLTTFVRRVRAGAATPEELMIFAAGRVAPYKKIRRVEFVGRIAKPASGKILRRLIVERGRAK